jgi:hypothetical protein
MIPLCAERILGYIMELQDTAPANGPHFLSTESGPAFTPRNEECPLNKYLYIYHNLTITETKK